MRLPGDSAMKTCPTCHQTYADDTLKYCLADGSVLFAPHDPDATIVMDPPAPPLPTVASPPSPTPPPLNPYPPGRQASGNHHLIYAVAGLLLGIVIVAGVALVVWLSFGSSSTNSANSPPSNAQTNQASAPSRNRAVHQYDKDGIHFSYYSDWSVAKDEPIGSTGNARAIHIEGPNNSVVSLICLPSSSRSTLEEFADEIAKQRPGLMKEEFRQNGISDPHIEQGSSEPIIGNIQGQPQNGIRQRFTIELARTKTPHEQDFYMVSGGRYKTMISAQVAEENLEQTRPDWQLIFDTLKF